MTTALKDIFLRPIDRPIEGVIKADDEENLRNELEEYELIPEVARRLEIFLDAYNNYTNANGVWLSGFFGCGKSHLLKMLSLVLENREVGGTKAADIFLPKCKKDSDILHADMEKAVRIPSKSILFNIDQKADVISKEQTDALIAVFIKVFDEACGYYGKQPYIAKFERELDQENLFESFKGHFERLANRGWCWGRTRPTRIASFVDDAYREVTGQPAKDVLDTYRSDYKLSIEDFADQINQYIAQQPPGFRLNFFVDEIGQYIADKTRLMTNLQTLAESLATKCRGQAWVIVTAQEEISDIIGDMTQSDSNADAFSKIQARFKYRLKLTSADAAEVIQLRLLTKDEQGINLLSDTYHQQLNNFNTLFSFTDGAQTHRNFKDKEHFIHCYPFIPYQFTLFQSAIQNLSRHNAFEGRHNSVGERSMLGVFQDVAKMVGDRPVGQLATFDLMYEGLRATLKSSVQSAIPVAEKNLGDPCAVRLLKALLLVKYVKEFKPTVRNMSILMLERFDQNISALHKKVEQGLALLEQQIYVQRNGDVYEYLTDEEKDVEKEIKNTEADSRKIAEHLEKMVFDSIIKHRKIRFDGNGQDYIYSRKLDEKLHGREHELAIHVISPFHENAGNAELLRMQSMGRDELLIVMPADPQLMQDLVMYEKTLKYIRHNSQNANDATRRIIAEKGQANEARKKLIQNQVAALLVKAPMIATGSDIEVNSEDAQTRIIRGFQGLINRVYPYLGMLRNTYKEEDIPICLEKGKDSLFSGQATNLSETEKEVLSFIRGNKRGGVKTSIKSLLEKFEKKPYGWYYAAILCTLAYLCARGKVDATIDGIPQEDSELASALRNTHGHTKVILEPQADFTAAEVRKLTDFYDEFFDSPPSANEAKALGNETGVKLEELHHKLDRLYAQNGNYPFLNLLKPVLDDLESHKDKPYGWYLTEFLKSEDNLLKHKETLIDPVIRFMANDSTQRAIYDEASAFILSQKDNFPYVQGINCDAVEGALTDKDCFRGNRMQQLKIKLDDLKIRVEEQLSAEIDTARTTIAGKKQTFSAQNDFSKITTDQQSLLLQAFDNASAAIANQKLIALVRDKLRTFEEVEYPQLLTQLLTRAAQTSPAAAGEGGNSKPHNEGPGSSGTVKPAPKVEIIAKSQIKVPFDQPLLANEQDIDRYLSSMREVLLTQIKEGKKVQV
ncbi:BREX system P-loop protein BrxC [Endozoicomonas sp. ONNA2]|uniref:BREX system P-loop protein BrxC n=1 Tax=Endozoicomonas sp. ONNA2 TaxID=2828741 RepID=UPI002148203A|nr:BREX system P-loop protein BrxC [Endozoicomonas sp. ONNA2]